jgi:8-oxo-dGTP pyrophosphatase MutT (NUDIX family)
MHIEIEKIKHHLSGPLPGLNAQRKMAPAVDKELNFNMPLQKAAVLVLLFSQNDCFYTVFIKRAEYEGHHSGQISFPGGKFESTDIHLMSTSLRETAEETGINASDISIIGKLTSLAIPVSNFEVQPFVGYIEKKPVFNPDPTEVEYLIEANLNILGNRKSKKNKIMTLGNYSIHVPYYDYQGNHIWGATAMMLSEFLEVLEMTGFQTK